MVFHPKRGIRSADPARSNASCTESGSREDTWIFFSLMLVAEVLLCWARSRRNHFDQIFNINVKGLLFTVQKPLPLLKDGGAPIESQYWTACFRDENGRQRRITTKETDLKKEQRLADEYEKKSRAKRTLRQAQPINTPPPQWGDASRSTGIAVLSRTTSSGRNSSSGSSAGSRLIMRRSTSTDRSPCPAKSW